MIESSVTVLAEGKSNFLIPNGTFLVELVIFLVVLAVIWKFVVPPIQSVLEAREAQAAKTVEDHHKAVKAHREAQQKYAEELAGARTEAAAVREQARAEGQRDLAETKAAAQAEVDQAEAAANERLQTQAAGIAEELKGSVGPLSRDLAAKVLGSGAGVSVVDGLGSAHDLAGRS